jgi:hypothetical protein
MGFFAAVSTSIAEEHAAWLRPVWDAEGGRLEIAARAFDSAERGDRIWLVGVTHVGESDYYTAVNELLDSCDVVVFESVLPVGGRPPWEAAAGEAVVATRKTADLLADVLAGTNAFDWNGAMSALAGSEARVTGLVRGLSRDGWNRPWMLARSEDGAATLTSLGSDGVPGGQGDAADIVATIPAQEPRVDEAMLQRSLAEMLGLTFQLDALPYDDVRWTPGDLDIEQLAAAFEARGQQIDNLTDLLSEQGLVGGIARGILAVIPTIDAMLGGRVVDTMKVLLIEMLGDEDMIDGALAMQGPAFREVLIDLRNERAMEVVDAIIACGESQRTVAVLYGAGHMAGLADLLSQRPGQWTPSGHRWLPAIEIDLSTSQLSQADVSMVKGWTGMFGRQLGR